MRVSTGPSVRPAVLIGAAVTAGLALAPAAGADVLASGTGEGAPASPVLVTPGGPRTLAALPSGDEGATPAVSPDRRFAILGRGEDTYLLPTDGTPATKLGAFAGAPSGGSAFWWTSAGRVVSYSAGLSVPGDIETCGVPTGGCSSRRAPGLARIGTFDGGAALFVRETSYELPDGLASAYQEWTTASAAQVRSVRRGLRRKHRQQVVLRSPSGALRVLSTVRRSAAQGTNSYLGYGELGPRVLYERVRTRTTLRTRTHGGRTQVRLRLSTPGASVTGVFSPNGRTHALRVRAPKGTSVSILQSTRPVPGGWLLGLSATDGKGTPLIGLLAPGGTVRTLDRDGRPLTARTLGAAIGLPVPASERGPELRPVGYEAATRSDVVAYDVPSERRTIVARIPRDGTAPTLVLRGEPGVDYALTAW